MLELPPVAPVVGWRSTTRLPRDHYVRVDSNDYSVHPAAVGRRVEIVAALDQVVVTLEGAEIARLARRCTPGCWHRRERRAGPRAHPVGVSARPPLASLSPDADPAHGIDSGGASESARPRRRSGTSTAPAVGSECDLEVTAVAIPRSLPRHSLTLRPYLRGGFVSRVLQWATGGPGNAAIDAVQAHPELGLVGCCVHSEAKHGLDVGDILGTRQVGVTAAGDVEDILALDTDVVVYAPLISNAGEVARILRAEEFSDMHSYDTPEVLRWVMGFGGTAEQARTSPMLGLLLGGSTESVRICLDTPGFADAPIQTSHQVAVAAAPIESPLGIIEPGQVAGQRMAWEFGPEGECYEIEIKTDPDTFVTIRGRRPAIMAEGLKRNPGIVATANHCVNSIPYVCAAAPGLESSPDLLVVAGRAHPDLEASRG